MRSFKSCLIVWLAVRGSRARVRTQGIHTDSPQDVE